MHVIMGDSGSLPRGRAMLAALAITAAAGLTTGGCRVPPGAETAPRQAADARVGLRPGFSDPGQAAVHLRLVSSTPPDSAFRATQTKSSFVNSDLAFRGQYVFQGNYLGFQVWDIADPRRPSVRATFVCPGGQGDPSIYGNLLFVSVEERSGRVDCGTQGVADSVSPERFRGVRIYDISDLDNPRQVAAVQTCRGSHTHTLVPHPKDPATIYVYVSEVSVVRAGGELAGCSGARPAEDPNTSLFRIDIIEVPLAHPETARIVSSPRIFADSVGNIAGLWPGGHHGEGTQATEETDQCHDITVYPAVGLAAGACSGNGILLDITDPVNPKRIDEVMDPNFAYWHSATFNNDASAVVFTDEWGGGSRPRCRASDPPRWGANAIYTLANRQLAPAGFFKLPAAQTEQENCVAHNGSLIPVPGRDIMVQGWYQGGVSVFDFTDPVRPVEIAYFDRGPLDSTRTVTAGQWGAYWYNGYIFGSEIARGLDLLELTPSRYLSQNEIDAARLVRLDTFNPQLQPRFVWPPSFVVARAYVDQLRRNGGLSVERLERLTNALRQAESATGEARDAELTAIAAELARDVADARDPVRVKQLASVLSQMANGQGAHS